LPELRFQAEGVEVTPYAAVPSLMAKFGIACRLADQVIHSMILRCQVQIEPAKRSYLPLEQANLLDLFGAPEQWGRSVRPLLWMNTSLVVPAFEGSTHVELPLPCSFDFNIGAAKYFHGLENGEVPVCVMFSGAVFYPNDIGVLQVAPIPWDSEVRFRIPVRIWKQMMETYYPNSAWLCLSREAFERLYKYKTQNGIPTWERVIDELFSAREHKEAGV
jgi:Family of unknown function (DUF6084)